MLENFQLVAIVRTGRKTRLLRIPLHQALQNTLAESWTAQYQAFTNDVEEIDFSAGYIPEAHERFRLSKYELPEWLREENSQTAADLDSITKYDASLDATQGLLAFARYGTAEILLFQNFSRSHVIRPGHFLFLEKGTYRTAKRLGLTLDDKLSAVFLPAECKLLFRSFHTVNTFLPLAAFHSEASEQEIREVLQHERLVAEDVDAVVVGANQWIRKRFAMLRYSKVLDQYTAKEIQRRSRGYEIDIRICDGKIVFPVAKREVKKLLQFLNEEIYRGAITETLYETNSKHKAG